MIVDAIRAALDAAVCDDAGEVLPPGTLAVTEREADEQGALRGAALAQLAETFDGLAEQYEGSEQRILNSDGDVEYQRWMSVTGTIEDAGGLLTIQTEEERTIQVP